MKLTTHVKGKQGLAAIKMQLQGAEMASVKEVFALSMNKHV